MFRVGDDFVLSPSDLATAIDCEFGLLRALDVKLGLLAKPAVDPDLMLERTAELGGEHESEQLALLRDKYGPYDRAAHAGVYENTRRSFSILEMRAAAAETLAVLRSGADVIYQAAFLRGRFNGYADLLIRDINSEPGRPRWSVYDTKLARHAKVTALLQMAAYAAELDAHHILVGPQVHLILGDGVTASYDTVDVVPAYRLRRHRLEQIIDQHQADNDVLSWDDPRYRACGRCETCEVEVQRHRSLLMVAGYRSAQQPKMMAAGITTIDELAASTADVPGISIEALTRLRAQAALQVQQRPPRGPDRPVTYDVFHPPGLALIPTPNPGDIFFDFEGDPLWTDADVAVSGLEYLFGVIELDPAAADGMTFRPFWAHNRAEEKAALIGFLNYLALRQAEFPDLHVYHYAPYEKSALLRLAARFGAGEAQVDDMLRTGTLVDLYGVVRNSLRTSQPSYSLKKLEPLYMGSELRTSEVKNAGDSIVAYADYCNHRNGGRPEQAAELLAEIGDYNRYDCLSTLRLRDWLLSLAAAHGITPIAPKIELAPTETDTLTVQNLLTHVPTGPAAARTADERAAAVLAAATGFHKREAKSFWHAHFTRLEDPIDDWSDTADVLVAAEVLVVSDWHLPEGKRNPRRQIRITGRAGSGSKPFADALHLLYDADATPVAVPNEPGKRGCHSSTAVISQRIDELGRDEVIIEESRSKDAAAWDQLPMAAAPGQQVRDRTLVAAIDTVAEAVLKTLAGGGSLGQAFTGQPALEILARRVPRLRSGTPLQLLAANPNHLALVTRAVADLEHSYLAVQGPPGSGKTYLGSRVIAHMVARGWKVGVVAQSQRVVEHMLTEIIAAGVKPDRCIKKPDGAGDTNGPWTSVVSSKHAAWIAEHNQDGFVIGGTAWDFVSPARVAPASLDLLVIDEAGQFSLANTIAVSVAAQRLLLLGDPQQLPQVTQGTHPEACDESALSWIMRGHHVMPEDTGYFLAHSWRLHPQLCRAVSVLSYDGQLTSNDAAGQRFLQGHPPGITVVDVAHQGNTVASPQEADEVISQVRRLLGLAWSNPSESSGTRPLEEQDLLVVAPYNAQVALVQAALRRAGFPHIRVGTVDKLQGQEAAVVIVTMTASSAVDSPRGMEFLLSRNRINVAISRGQWAAVILRSPQLTNYLPSNPQGLVELGAFIGLCDRSS